MRWSCTSRQKFACCITVGTHQPIRIIFKPLFLYYVSPVDVVCRCSAWGDLKQLVCGRTVKIGDVSTGNVNAKCPHAVWVSLHVRMCECACYRIDVTYASAFREFQGFGRLVTPDAIDVISRALKMLRDLLMKLHFVWVRFIAKFICFLKLA